MQRCMFCNRTGRIFNIYEDWNGKHTIKDDLIEIFGQNTAEYLFPDDVVCNKCMNILENFAKLKRRLWPLITDRNSKLCNVKPIKFGKLWDVFATCQIPDDPDTLMGCPSPSLLKYSHSKPYQDAREMKIAEREHARSMSRTSLSEVSLNREVSELLSKKKRKKRKARKKLWTHRKSRSRSASKARSTGALSYYRVSPTVSVSSYSEASYSTNYTPHTAPERYMGEDEFSVGSSHALSMLKYCDGKLVNKRTRSVSRLQELEAQFIAENEEIYFHCGENGCTEAFDDLDTYTAHKRIDHRIMALYACTVGCRGLYLTKDDLELHRSLTHEQELLICSMCGIEIEGATAFQEHVEEHLIHSVPCLYCDKCFLDKRSKDEHIKEYHKGKKKRIKPKPHFIIDRIKKNESEDDTSESSISPVPYDKKKFFVGILTPPPPMEEDEEEEDNGMMDINEDWFVETQSEDMVDVTSRNSGDGVRILIQSNISVNSEICDNDNIEDVEEVTVTSPVIFEVPCDEFCRSPSRLSTESSRQPSLVNAHRGYHEVVPNSNYLTLSDLSDDDVLFTKTLKVVLVDCLRYKKPS